MTFDVEFQETGGSFDVEFEGTGDEFRVPNTFLDVVTPRAKVTKTGKASVLTVTDVDGITTVTIYDGEDGDTPEITAERTGTVTIIYADGVEIARINDGAKGDKGDSPVITATKTGKKTEIYADGVKIAEILDGSDGADALVMTASNVTETTFSVDKSRTEVITAAEAGKIILLKIQTADSNNYVLMLSQYKSGYRDMNFGFTNGSQNIVFQLSCEEPATAYDGVIIVTEGYNAAEKQKVADAYADRHSHANKSLLDAFSVNEDGEICMTYEEEQE